MFCVWCAFELNFSFKNYTQATIACKEQFGKKKKKKKQKIKTPMDTMNCFLKYKVTLPKSTKDLDKVITEIKGLLENI